MTMDDLEKILKDFAAGAQYFDRCLLCPSLQIHMLGVYEPFQQKAADKTRLVLYGLCKTCASSDNFAQDAEELLALSVMTDGTKH